MLKFKNTYFKKHEKLLPVLIRIILALIVSIIIIAVIINRPENGIEEDIILYQIKLPFIFKEIENDNSGYSQEIPELKKEADYYETQNDSFITKIPGQNYQDPFEFERRDKKLQIVSITPIIKTVRAKQDRQYLFYKNVYQSTDVVKKIQPDGVKEFIILKSKEAPKQFEWVLNVSDQTEVIKDSDGSIRFYEKTDQEKHSVDGLFRKGPDNFLYRIPAPYMMDINYEKSTNCQWQLVQINSSQYNLTLTYNPDDLTYPIAIDPTITDTYDNEDKVADTTNTEVTGGQAKLKITTGWYTDWDYRKKITINAEVVSGSMTNFPMMVNIASDSDLAADPQEDGDDILFTSSDGETKLNHEIEKYDGTDGDLIAWVNVPSFTSASNTDIYMYYGNVDAGDQQSVDATWDENFLAVWHMDDGTTSTILDSSGNGYSGTKTGANQPIVTTDGRIGNAQSFDNSNDRINVGDIDAAQITLSAWIKMPSGVTYQEPVVNKGYTSHDSPYYQYFLYITTTNEYVRIFASKANKDSTADIADSSWHYIHGVFNGTTLAAGSDGSNWGSKAETGDTPNYATDAYIGGYTNLSTVGDAYYFNGLIDEVRISDIGRTEQWIINEYNNMNSPDTFYTVGNEESLYPASGTLTSTNLLSGASVVTIDSFYYDASSISSGTELEVQFSQDNSNWYSASGSADWTTLDTTGGEGVDLSGLGWTGGNFYYKLQFKSNTSRDVTPIVDEIAANYIAGPTIIRLKGGVRLKGGTRIK